MSIAPVSDHKEVIQTTCCQKVSWLGRQIVLGFCWLGQKIKAVAFFLVCYRPQPIVKERPQISYQTQPASQVITTIAISFQTRIPEAMGERPAAVIPEAVKEPEPALIATPTTLIGSGILDVPSDLDTEIPSPEPGAAAAKTRFSNNSTSCSSGSKKGSFRSSNANTAITSPNS